MATSARLFDPPSLALHVLTPASVVSLSAMARLEGAPPELEPQGGPPATAKETTTPATARVATATRVVLHRRRPCSRASGMSNSAGMGAGSLTGADTSVTAMTTLQPRVLF